MAKRKHTKHDDLAQITVFIMGAKHLFEGKTKGEIEHAIKTRFDYASWAAVRCGLKAAGIKWKERPRNPSKPKERFRVLCDITLKMARMIGYKEDSEDIRALKAMANGKSPYEDNLLDGLLEHGDGDPLDDELE